VAADHLGRRIDGDVGAARQRLSVVGAGKGVVDDDERLRRVRLGDRGDPGDVRDDDERVGRALEEDDLSMCSAEMD